MRDIAMRDVEVRGKTRAIVCFGPMTPMLGTQPGRFFQVTIDPNMASPGRDYIRFDNRAEDEIHGWQQISALTICEVLEEHAPHPDIPSIFMRAVVKE